MKKILLSLLLLAIALSSHTATPRLIIQLVVDQLRGDLIAQHQQQFSNNGFNYLLSHGINYNNAHHPHANTTTCTGHATIATGSYPALHGVVNNDWFDRKSKKMIYCMEDLNAKILPTNHTKSPNPGRSPMNLTGSTISDEIVLAKKGRAFGVSLKDRSAITLAGHAGKAFWFDKTNGGFVSSNYYYKSYPTWVEQWNKSYTPQAFTWNLSKPNKEYQNANNPAFNHDDKGFGVQFPHHVGNPTSADYFTMLATTPIADQLTADFAEQLLIAEHLGTSANQTDYLAISFSVVDVIGHQFGPNSLEAEENLLQLDKTLANLLSVIDKQVGLNNTLIILTADHGVADSPPYLKANHMIEAPAIDITAITQLIQQELAARYQLPKETLMTVAYPYIYLDHEILHAHKINTAQASRFVAQILINQPGIFKAYALPLSGGVEDWLSTKVNRMAYPYRAGDVYIVTPPYQNSDMSNEHKVFHGTPWQYDSYVPLLFVNPALKTQIIARQVATTDIASTLSSLLMIKPPSAAVGKPLKEIVQSFNNLNT